MYKDYKDINSISIDQDKVIKFLGYGGGKPSRLILKKIEEEIEVFREYVDIIIYKKCLKILNIRNDLVVLENGIELSSKHLANSLIGCKKIYIIFTSLGPRIDEKISSYSNNFDLSRSLVLDKLAIVGLDDINEKVKGYITNKESPKIITSEIFTGERDFSTDNTAKLLSVFENPDIKINDYNILEPKKTVAYILGIGDDDRLIDKCKKCENPCH